MRAEENEEQEMLQLLGFSGLNFEWDQEKYGENAEFGVKKCKFKCLLLHLHYLTLRTNFLHRASASFLWQKELDEAST